jgi:hypothetical protein
MHMIVLPSGAREVDLFTGTAANEFLVFLAHRLKTETTSGQF